MEQLFTTYAKQSIEQAAQQLNTSLTNGLSSAEVQERQQKYGMNLLPKEKISWISLLIKQVYSSFFILFFLLALLSFIFGEQLNAIIILVFLAINAGVGFYQEFQAYKDLESLQKYLVALITVL